MGRGKYKREELQEKYNQATKIAFITFIDFDDRSRQSCRVGDKSH